MWQSEPTIASLPRVSQWTNTEIRLPMVPVGTNNAASFPNILAPSSSSSVTVGSSRMTSSPTAQVAMARRIAAVGLVTVSERRSMGAEEV